MALIKPTARLHAISDISIDALSAKGISCVLFDRDNTVVPRDTKTVPPEVSAWLDAVRAAGIKVCMVSNNFHTTEIEASAAELGCEVIHHAMKPFPFAINAALKKMGAQPSETVLVGDQVFTDVMAGNLAGIRTILVDPQSRTDLWYTHIFRVFEAAVGARKDEGDPTAGFGV